MERNQLGEKVIQINQDLCTGCGSCADLCSIGAIHLVDHRAEIDQDLCIACEICLNACSNGAITVASLPFIAAPTPIKPLDGSKLGVRQPAALPETNVFVHGFKSLTCTVLAFLESEIAPHMVDLAIKSIEHKLTQPATTSVSPMSSSTHASGLHNRGQLKHIRYRGGRAGNKKNKGRR